MSREASLIFDKHDIPVWMEGGKRGSEKVYF